MNALSTHRRRALVALAGASLVFTTACGSTVQNSGQTAPGGDVLAGEAPAGAAGDGLGGAGAPAPGSELGGPAAPGSDPAGGAVAGGQPGPAGGAPAPGAPAPGGAQQPQGAPGPAGPAPQGAPPGGPAPKGGAAAGGPGITATEVRIGVPFCNDCDDANEAAGAGGEGTGDTKRYYKAAIDDVNSRGGVLGRKLVPVWHELSVADNIDQSSQEMCETFTKDNEVAAIFHRGDVIYQCALTAGVMVVGGGGTAPVFQRYPNLFAPSSIRLENLFGTTVRAMVKAGWHKPDATYKTGKIGLITWNSTEYQYAMKNGYLKAMKETGLKAEEVRYIAVPQNANALADASAAISNAVLSFRQKGIDHVFIGDGPAGIFAGTGLTFLFLSNSQSQSYFPRYGFNSNNSPDFDNHPPEQLVNMLAIDSFDTEAANDEGIALHPGRERCLKIMKSKGLNVSDSQTSLLAINACDIAWFSQAALTKAGGSTLRQIIPGAESLGTSYRSTLTYGTRLGKGRHDGVHLFRNLRWDAPCKCTKYTSKPYEP